MSYNLLMTAQSNCNINGYNCIVFFEFYIDINAKLHNNISIRASKLCKINDIEFWEVTAYGKDERW